MKEKTLGHIDKKATELEKEWDVGGVWGNTLYSDFFLELLKRIRYEIAQEVIEEYLEDIKLETDLGYTDGGIKGFLLWLDEISNG